MDMKSGIRTSVHKTKLLFCETFFNKIQRTFAPKLNVSEQRNYGLQSTINLSLLFLVDWTIRCRYMKANNFECYLIGLGLLEDLEVT